MNGILCQTRPHRPNRPQLPNQWEKFLNLLLSQSRPLSLNRPNLYLWCKHSRAHWMVCCARPEHKDQIDHSSLNQWEKFQKYLLFENHPLGSNRPKPLLMLHTLKSTLNSMLFQTRPDRPDRPQLPNQWEKLQIILLSQTQPHWLNRPNPYLWCKHARAQWMASYARPDHIYQTDHNSSTGEKKFKIFRYPRPDHSDLTDQIPSYGANNQEHTEWHAVPEQTT